MRALAGLRWDWSPAGVPCCGRRRSARRRVPPAAVCRPRPSLGLLPGARHRGWPCAAAPVPGARRLLCGGPSASAPRPAGRQLSRLAPNPLLVPFPPDQAEARSPAQVLSRASVPAPQLLPLATPDAACWGGAEPGAVPGPGGPGGPGRPGPCCGQGAFGQCHQLDRALADPQGPALATVGCAGVQGWPCVLHSRADPEGTVCRHPRPRR